MFCPQATRKITFPGDIPKNRVWDRDSGANWGMVLQYKPLGYKVEQATEGEGDESDGVTPSLTHKRTQL